MKFKYYVHSLFLGFSVAAMLTASSSAIYAEETANPSEETAIDYHTYAQGLFQVSAFCSPDYVWDLKTCTVLEKDNNQLQLYHPLDVNQQKFYFENFAPDSWRISDIRSGLALTVSGDGSSVSMNAMEHPSEAEASASQTWILQDAGNNAFYIQNTNGKYLTRNGNRNYCGDSLSLTDFTGHTPQKWCLNKTWISTEDSADTDLVNPYAEDGPYGNLHLKIQIAEGQESLTASMLAEHMTETENHEYALDPEYLPSFAAELASKYDTQDNSRRFITSAGNEILLTKGNFGWKLNQQETIAAIHSNLQTDKILRIKPVYIHKVTKLGNPNEINDLGDSYIEVDIGTQHIWLYQYGELIMDSDCVTGTYHSTDTVQGAFAIFLKQAPATLTGPGYTSYVDFWMPFYNGYGLHNAGWRNAFGGEIYKTSGSHGCVNLPFETAQTIYNTVKVGYPVVVYSSLPGDGDY